MTGTARMPDGRQTGITGADPGEFGALITAAQVRLLMSQRSDLLISPLIAGLLVPMVWSMYPAWVLVAWLGALIAVILLRQLQRRRYARAAPGPERARQWGNVFALGTFVTGCFWGLSGSIVVVTTEPIYHLLIVFVLGGMVASTIVVNAAYLPAMVGFLVPAMLPVIVALASRAAVLQMEMAAMLTAFLLVVLLAGQRLNASIVENLRARFAQDRLLAELGARTAEMHEAQAIARVGNWSFDTRTRVTGWSDEAFRILGLDPAHTVPSRETLLERIHPLDRAAVAAKIDELIAHGTGDTIDHRIVTGDGTTRYVHEIMQATVAPGGEVLTLFGTMQDISELRAAGEALAYRDELLRAVTMSISIMVKAEPIDQALPQALQIVCECLKVDRVVMMQESYSAEASGVVPTLRTMWQAPDIPVESDQSVFIMSPTEKAVVAAWHAPLLANQPVVSQLASSNAALQALLRRIHVQSHLLVPIFVNERLWGSLGFDACRAPREWTANEIGTLRMFGEVAGSLIANEEIRRALRRSDARFRLVTEAAQDAIITVDPTARIVVWNSAARSILGFSAEEAVGHRVHDLIAPERFRAKADACAAGFALTGEGDAIGRLRELTAVRKDGTEITVELSLSRLRLDDSWGAVGILRDITARKAVGDGLAFARLLSRTVMEASPDGVIVVDADARIIEFNQRFAAMWSIPPEDMAAGRDAAPLAQVTKAMKDPEAFLARVQHLYEHPGEDSQDDLETTDGRSIDRRTVTLYGPTGTYLGRAWFFRDITERKRLAELALRKARVDELTGLANRTVFVEALRHAIATANRGDERFAVLYLDLDLFKDVNDTLGHPVGDALLVAVAGRLRANTRDIDTVARFGGDEFAILLANTRDPADAGLLADTLITEFGTPFGIQGHKIHCGITIGIATYSADAPDAEVLLSNADVALYRAKADGRGGYQFFTQAMDADVQARVKIGAELRTAVDAGQLFLMYQPQVDISNGRITGLEALVRWRHPQRGLIQPGLFIPIAEKIGIIAKLGHWALWEACRQAAVWYRAGIAVGRVGVNVSALQFHSPITLEADIAAALAQTGLPPHLLELELTESVVMDATKDHGEIIQRIRGTGVSIAIDDFGTGYSSLDYLRRYPSNRIKIAQNFVSQMETQPGDAAIVRATIGLARELNINVIAEGVETRAQLEMLKSWGCGEVQGFYFARPLAADDATAALRAGQIIPRGDAAPG